MVDFARRFLVQTDAGVCG